MNKGVEIENIEEMREQVGIDDVELREAVRGLRPGDVVRLTLVTAAAPAARETIRVRVAGARARSSWAGSPTARARPAWRPCGPGRASPSGPPTSIPSRKDGRPMRDDAITLHQAQVRAADSNSLLRLYDLSRELLANARSQQERARADKAVRRIAKELEKRNVPL